jgi:branched-chain amino acid transport system permease protein
MDKIKNFFRMFSVVPLAGWLFGSFVAVLLEYYLGDAISYYLYLPKIPVLFGTLIMLKEPMLIPSVLAYDLIIYALPILLLGKMLAPIANTIAARLDRMPLWVATLVHLVAFYGILHLWAGINDYRVLVVKLTMVSIILTISLNIINGYQGEFSCSHPGFMALGAYTASALTLLLFTDDKMFGEALLPAAMGPWLFPLILVAGGAVAAIGSLAVAIPSFRTRGDYLAIISLAFMFIVKSAVENLEILGGPRGLSSQPDYASLPVVFIWVALCVWIIHNFTTSIMGKALNAVRDSEAAAHSMTVNTRKTKVTAFMFGAFWAGVAGGLAMVYFGGLNSIYGSIVGAVSISVLGEALRPLELFKWIIIPLILILVMIFRPHGLISFTELNVKEIMRPRDKKPSEGVE